jgi:hypothetical protein
MATRAALHRAGASVLEELLARAGGDPAAGCLRLRTASSLSGEASEATGDGIGEGETERPYYFCAYCHQGQSPRDEELDLEGARNIRRG